MPENEIKSITPQMRFTRTQRNVDLAINTKESFEVLAELFIGNSLYETEKAVLDVKLTKIIDML